MSDFPSLKEYAFWVDSSHSTLYPMWPDEEKANPKLAKARLLVELGLTENTPELLTPLWKNALDLGFSVDALKVLTILSNHRAAAESWMSDFQWGFEPQTSPFIPDIPSQIDKLLYNKEDPSHPPLEGLEKELLLKDADQVLAVFLKHGFWENTDWTLFVPDLWQAPYQGMPWWTTALALNAQKCADLAYPELFKHASQDQLDQALMVVWLSQLNALADVSPRKSTLEEQEKSQMSSENAAKWTTRLLELGANPYRLFELDREFDERLYTESAADYAPRSSGVQDRNSPYCVAHLALHVAVKADRYESFKAATQSILPKLDAQCIPLDAWGRDVASLILLSSTELFYKSQFVSHYQGETAIAWLFDHVQIWGDEKSVERGWNPAITLWHFGLKKEQACAFLLNHQFFEKIKTPLIAWKVWQSELRSYAFDNASFVPNFEKDGSLKSWAYAEGGILEAITPCLEESIRIPWLNAIAFTRDKMLQAFSQENQTLSPSRDREMFEQVKLEQSAAIDAHKLHWEVFRNTEDPSLSSANTPSKLRL